MPDAPAGSPAASDRHRFDSRAAARAQLGAADRLGARGASDETPLVSSRAKEAIMRRGPPGIREIEGLTERTQESRGPI